MGRSEMTDKPYKSQTCRQTTQGTYQLHLSCQSNGYTNFFGIYNCFGAKSGHFSRKSTIKPSNAPFLPHVLFVGRCIILMRRVLNVDSKRKDFLFVVCYLTACWRSSHLNRPKQFMEFFLNLLMQFVRWDSLGGFVGNRFPINDF